MQIGFLGALGLLFICLKLTECISWSWWLVLLPLYGGPVVAFLFILTMTILAALIGGKIVMTDTKGK